MNKAMELKRILAWITLICALLTVFSLGMFVRCNIQNNGLRVNGERIRDLCDDLNALVSQAGPEALDGFQSGIWAEDTGRFNALVLDGQGAVVNSLNGGMLPQGTADGKIFLMISPYGHWRTDWEYHTVDMRGNTTGIANEDRMRLALLVDGQGEILRAFLTNYQGAAVGKNLPRYNEYFYPIQEAYYHYQTSQNRSYWSDGTVGAEDVPDFGTKAERSRTQQYIDWEQQQMDAAGQARLVYQPMHSDQTLLMLYQNDDILNGDSILSLQLSVQLQFWLAAFGVCLSLTWLLLALWVLCDARFRGFRPALWGVLGLIGGPVAWIIYLIVRPERMQSAACSVCGAPVRPEFVACPRCGTPLRRQCAHCGRALEPDWRVCPYCAQPLQGETLGETSEALPLKPCQRE